MTDPLVSLVRQLGPRDHLRFPELAKISACVEAFAAGDPPPMDAFLSALGDEIDDVTLVRKHPDGSYHYSHFGARLAGAAGFDMTGKTTADFDPETRKHIEASFKATQENGGALCTLLPGVPGSTVSSWQRVVYLVELAEGPHFLTMVKPLRTALDAIHARQDEVAVCVVPLRINDEGGCYTVANHIPLQNYLGDSDVAPLENFLAGIGVPDPTPAVGALIATHTFQLRNAKEEPLSLIVDIVQGFTTPFMVVINATSSSQTHEQLRSTAHLLKASFELGRLGSWINSGRPDRRLLVAEELADMLGLPIGQDRLIPLKDIRDLYEPDLLDAAHKAVKTCWDTGESFVIEGGLRRPDGHRLQVRISGSPMRDEAGKIISLFGLIQDISAEHAAQQRLQYSEERFRDFASSAGDWCWETDEQHCFVDFTGNTDESSLDLQEHYIGKTRLDFDLVAEDRPLMEAHFEDLEAHREIKEFVYRVRRIDSDEIVCIKISGKPRFSDDGTFLGYRGTGRNITAKVLAEQKSRENQLALKSAQTIAKVGHWVTDLRTRATRCSDGLIALLGPDMLAELLDDEGGSIGRAPSWRALLACIHTDDRHAFRSALRKASAGATVDPIDIRYFPTGAPNPKYFRIMMQPREASSTHGPQMMGVVQDVSDLKQTQQELEKRTATLSEAQEMGGIGDWQFEFATRTLIWSHRLYDILRLDPETFEPTEESVFGLCNQEDCAVIRAEHDAAIQGKPSSSVDVRARRGDGSFGYYTMMTKPLHDGHGKVIGLFGTVQDITERKQAEKQLRELAYFDTLTGLANRALFTRELHDVMETVQTQGGSAALFLLDLDHFKEVNDTLGHAAGDELLRTVAQSLKDYVGQKGFVARLGGDEFAIIIRNYFDVQCLDSFARGVVNQLTGVLKLQRGEVMTGTSIGIALIPQDGGDAEEVLRNADLALYMVKDEGRGKAFFFTPEMSRSVQARLKLARDLRFAIENDALESRFQGQVDLKTGKVAGFETLVRWKHPTRGYVSPTEFIPVAESSSLICDIGLWILRDACKTGRAWLDAGEPERMISVNVSAAQIWQSEFETDVMTILEETGYPAHLLCLELTESVFADHGEGRVRKVLARLKAAGLRLALDDFGTGYSSLGYLNDLPFDELKIDRCFVAGVHNAPDKARLLQGIIALGRGLGMRVVGEGAEEEGEIALLRAYGCDVVQGFAYLRPETADDALRAAEQLEFRLAETAKDLNVMGDPFKKTA